MSTAVPFLPDTAPFSPEQRAWLNGFLAGIFSRSAPAAAPAAAPAKPLTILFGSQTGTAEGLAKRAAKEAAKRGFAPTLKDMNETPLAALTGDTAALVIVSTYGDGEPPDGAKALHGALAVAGAPRLEQLSFTVCALGDRNYAKFCQCGKDFDARLAALGAKRAAALVECDVDYEGNYVKWLDAAFAALGSTAAAPAPAAAGAAPLTLEAEPAYSKTNPFPATVVAVRCLNGAGSAKEVNHVEFSLEGSGLSYEAGDALGVVPQNDPALVSAVLETLGCDGEEPVATPAGELPLRTALLLHYDLAKPTAELLAACGVAAAPELFHVIDVVSAAGAKKLPPAEFVKVLRKLQPRLYSISSSPKAHPGQVHLTVGAVRFDLHGRARKGVCSTFLAERALACGKVGVYVHANKAFRPPANGDTPVIMVGPGTGIAPFRAFLEERRATGAKGKNWLLFGDQKESSDFLYRDELLALQADGFLTRLDLAWSRDQSAKVYVQNRMTENAAELWAWLEAGAHFYVCGDASRMAKDVHAALHKVVEVAGGKSPEAAAEYVAKLQSAKRYQRDVY